MGTSFWMPEQSANLFFDLLLDHMFHLACGFFHIILVRFDDVVEKTLR